MRYINLNDVIASIPVGIKSNLSNIDASMITKNDQQKAATASNGNVHWTQTKNYLENASNRKCWYTESKNPGCQNDVEHFRPKARVFDKDQNLLHWYWFLAFNPTNYRLSAQIPNRLNNNPLRGITGGKGDHFPLVNNTPHATNIATIPNENPALLDPCNINDVRMLAFNPDGRPALSPEFAGDDVAKRRVETSNLLLNLDFPTFNEDRESLYNRIKELVERGDAYFVTGNIALDHLKQDLLDLMHPDSAYSKAAECYIRCFRDRSWIEEMLF